MKKNLIRLVAMLICVACVFSMVACGGGETEEKKPTDPVDGNMLFRNILTNVTFDTQLQSVGEHADLYFSKLPEGAQVMLYTGSAYYADCIALITVQKSSDRAAAVSSLQSYISQMTEHFRNYQPDQLTKLEDAVIWDQDVYALLCITADYETVKGIIADPSKYTYTPAQTQPSEEVQTTPSTEPEVTQQTTEEVTEPSTEAPTEPGTYPTLTSQSGVLHDYGTGVYRVDDMAYEGYYFSESTAKAYANVVNNAYAQLGPDINVYDIIIPTAIGIVMPDDIIPQFSVYEDQGARMQQIFGMMDEGVIRVNCYDNLMKHRDEYLYFNTDYHWNGAAAYYAYETFCQAKGVTPYTMEQRKHSEFGDFMGQLYLGGANKDPNLTVDVVHAYHPYFDDISMVFTDRNGEQVAWNVIMDVSTWNSGSKYNAFAGGDNPITVYKNPHVTEGVAIVIKESFGNALIPYIVDHYSTVYEIDYRYWEGNIADFAHANGVNDVIFANNIGMIRADMLVGMLADNF